MSHLTVKDEVVRDDQNSQKWTKEIEEARGSCPANTKETPTEKVKAEGSTKGWLISKFSFCCCQIKKKLDFF